MRRTPALPQGDRHVVEQVIEIVGIGKLPQPLATLH